MECFRHIRGLIEYPREELVRMLRHAFITEKHIRDTDRLDRDTLDLLRRAARRVAVVLTRRLEPHNLSTYMNTNETIHVPLMLDTVERFETSEKDGVITIKMISFKGDEHTFDIDSYTFICIAVFGHGIIKINSQHSGNSPVTYRVSIQTDGIPTLEEIIK